MNYVMCIALLKSTTQKHNKRRIEKRVVEDLSEHVCLFIIIKVFEPCELSHYHFLFLNIAINFNINN